MTVLRSCPLSSSTLLRFTAIALFAAALLIPARGRAEGVSPELLLNAQDRDDVWVHYNKNYQGWRYMPTDQINRDNVHRLVPIWSYQTGVLGGGFETTAVLHDGLLYITTPQSHLICVDARTGKEQWRYDHVLPEGVNLCCGPVNRGVAILGDTVYWVTLDAHLMAFDAKTGLQQWDRVVADYRASYSLTLAPLVIKDMVIIGISGAEYGIRGFIEAFEAETGESRWKFYTVPNPGEPGSETWEGDSWMNGGGPAWLTGTYDPDLDLLYWGIGNPSPDFNGDVRKGDNLYTDSVVALNPNTGELVWYFQMTPHDIFDWDGVSEPVLVDEVINGEEVKALIQANRNGYVYALDRTNGDFLYASPYTRTTWANIDEEGKPVIKPEILEQRQIHVCPGIFGGKNWSPSAYSPDTHMIYIPEIEHCSTFSSLDVTFRRGLPYYGGTLVMDSLESARGFIKAMDVRTGEIKWTYDTGTPNWAGLLTTRGGLVFGGEPDGHINAFHDETGEVLWRYQTGSGVFAPPTSYVIDGKQYIGVASGWGQPAEVEGIAVSQTQGGSTYYMFGLMEE